VALSNLASAHSFKSEMRNFKGLAEAPSGDHPGYSDLNSPLAANVENIRSLGPEVLIISTGARTLYPKHRGHRQTAGRHCPDVITGKSANPGGRVIVAGAGLTGCEEALDLAQQGKSVVFYWTCLPFC